MALRNVAYGLLCLAAILCSGCANRQASLDAPVRSQLEGKRVVVFPFQDPYYRGNQVRGVGGPFAAVFVTKLQAAGVLADGVKGNTFSSSKPIKLDKACKYAQENSYEALLVGTVTEWIDGRTQWSGTVDVAAVTVSVYRPTNCELVGSASGRENGRLLTLVDAPTTRFFAPLSEAIIATLLEKDTSSQQ